MVPYQSGPLYSDMAGPVNLTQNEIGSKTGQACTTNILGLVATGDASAAAAAKAGGINEISTVDVEFSTILGLFAKSCTTVTGN